jgi:hypothetical protein
MKRIKDKDISVTLRADGAFTLSYITNERDYCKRYTGCCVKDAKKRFKEYVYEQSGKAFRRITHNDVMVRALGCVCGGLSAAREMLDGGFLAGE